MNIWALADLHLPLSVPEKTMEVFGPSWKNYVDRIKYNWEKRIGADDLVLLAGDICWAQKLDEALIDLNWIDQLPGTKVVLKGNHDHWWSSNKKLEHLLPSSIHFIYNTVFNWKGVSIGGSRLWDSDEYHFDKIIESQPNPFEKKRTQEELLKEKALRGKIFRREIDRLKLSLSQLDQNADLRLAMTHYPPISADLQDSIASKLFEAYHVDTVIFGHLHHVTKNQPIFGEKNGVQYLLTSADYLEFKPLKLAAL
jgi:predicted phosphohydrolase